MGNAQRVHRGERCCTHKGRAVLTPDELHGRTRANDMGNRLGGQPEQPLHIPAAVWATFFRGSADDSRRGVVPRGGPSGMVAGEGKVVHSKGEYLVWQANMHRSWCRLA